MQPLKTKRIFKSKQGNKVCVLEFLFNVCHYNVHMEGLTTFTRKQSVVSVLWRATPYKILPNNREANK
jgi:hypothetical protein